MFVCPGEVFDEIVSARPAHANWLVPLALVCLTSLILLGEATPPHQPGETVGQLVDAGKLSAGQAEMIRDQWHTVSAGITCLGAIAGTAWSALVLWGIGRVLLKSRFSYVKALEVAGLTTMILVLANVVTALLIRASGSPGARPALSLLFPEVAPDNAFRQILDLANGFHLWTLGVLVVGLSKLSGVSLKEAAFWILGYWVFFRSGLILLS
jgi:hypothetical protein